MTDGEALLLAFVLIYLSDCLVWLTPAGYAFIAFWGRDFAPKRATVSFDALRKGFAVLNPLPPLGTVFVSEAWPVSPTEVGIAPFSRENPNPGSLIGALPGTDFVAWDEIETIRARDAYLEINRKRFAHCASRQSAQRLAEDLESVRQCPESEREMAIAALVRRRMNAHAARRRARLFRKATGSMRFSAVVLFFSAFLLLPYAYWRFQDEPRFLLALGAVWLVMLQISIEFARLHRRFYPELAAERWQHFCFAIVFPHYAIRSLDMLARGFLAGSHPFAISSALASTADATLLADRLKRDAESPIPLPPEGLATEAAETFRSHYFLPALRKAMQEQPQTSLAAAGPEAPSDAPPAAFCPRCHTAYEASGIPCPDCGGLSTVPTNA